jgi:hypothetical protein
MLRAFLFNFLEVCMSDSPQNVAGQPAGQPVQPSATEAAPSTQAAGLTIQDVQRAIRDALTDNQREQQSQRDKLENRVRTEVNRVVSTLKASGIEPTPEQLATMEKSTRQAIQDESGTTQQAPAQAHVPENPEANPIVALAGEIMAEYGIQLEESDPEATALKTFKGTNRQWLAAVENAVKAKKERISAPVAEPGARITTITGGSSPGNPIAGVTNTDELWRMAKQQKKL